MSPLDARTADAYHATWFDYVDAGGRRFVAQPTDAQSGNAPAWDLPAEFAVVTAHNPGSVSRPEVENEDANRRLRADLVARGAAVRDIVGRSADGSWREASLAVWNVPLADLEALAAAHGQCAIFVVVAGGRRRLGNGTHRVDVTRGEWLDVAPV
ncbi:MAG TPA: DUF3293 domain-containing protein [Candidatus Binatia bacterium]|jgi:hypothetical protein|nr:DUF3293 domain-containing protein [Candidatus Binatia bacterium]